MNSKLVSLGLVALLLGCSDPEQSSGACTETVPDGVDKACEGAGECDSPLVCEGVCSLPPAMTGEGGSAFILASDLDDRRFQAEVAESDLARTRGLANRSCIEDGWGMLLVWPSAEVVNITMAGVRFNLDIAFIDDSRQVVDVRRDLQAGSKALYQSSQEVRWVFEAPAGDLADVEPGWTASLE